ncbi:hypothetical protein Bca4012_082992 [Brassica carinata]
MAKKIPLCDGRKRLYSAGTLPFERKEFCFLNNKVASTVDAVLLSHPDILHLGALPYAMKQLGLSAPIYATEPVHRLDTAGRVLELLLILEQHWSQRAFSFPIYFLTYVSSSTIDYVKSFLEWMSTPFQSPLRLHVIMPLLRHVTLLINETDLDNAPPGPKTVFKTLMCQLDLLYNSLSRTVQILLCCGSLNTK